MKGHPELWPSFYQEFRSLPLCFSLFWDSPPPSFSKCYSCTELCFLVFQAHDPEHFYLTFIHHWVISVSAFPQAKSYKNRKLTQWVLFFQESTPIQFLPAFGCSPLPYNLLRVYSSFHSLFYGRVGPIGSTLTFLEADPPVIFS